MYFAGNNGCFACLFVEIIVIFFLKGLKLFVRNRSGLLLFFLLITVGLQIFTFFVGGGFPVNESDVLLNNLHVGDDFVGSFSLLGFHGAIIAVNHFQTQGQGSFIVGDILITYGIEIIAVQIRELAVENTSCNDYFIGESLVFILLDCFQQLRQHLDLLLIDVIIAAEVDRHNQVFWRSNRKYFFKRVLFYNRLLILYRFSLLCFSFLYFFPFI